MNSLAVVDWLAITVLALSLLWGVWRGLVHEVLGLLGWLLAFWVAQRYAPALSGHISAFGSEAVRLAAAFFGVFLATVIAVAVLIWMLGRIMSAVGLRPIDRILGAFFGVMRALLLLLVLGVLVNAAGWNTQAWWSESVAGPLITQVLQVGKAWMPEPWASYL
jgi:membrane protein required for colicin V production